MVLRGFLVPHVGTRIHLCVECRCLHYFTLYTDTNNTYIRRTNTSLIIKFPKLIAVQGSNFTYTCSINFVKPIFIKLRVCVVVTKY